MSIFKIKTSQLHNLTRFPINIILIAPINMFKIVTSNNLYFKLFQIVVILELFQTITEKISKGSIHFKIHIYLRKHLHFCAFNHKKCRSLLPLCILIKFCNFSWCLTCSSHCLYWHSKTITSCNFVGSNLKRCTSILIY